MNPSQAAPGSQASLREANRLRVLDALREQGAMTQVEIAGSTGLSPATVSNMVKELDAAGAVELAPSIRNGRRAVLVSLATGNTLLAGIAFGDRDVRVAIATGPRDIVGRHRMPLPASHNADEGMERAARRMRHERPFLFSNLKSGQGVAEIVSFIETAGMLNRGETAAA